MFDRACCVNNFQISIFNVNDVAVRGLTTYESIEVTSIHCSVWLANIAKWRGRSTGERVLFSMCTKTLIDSSHGTLYFRQTSIAITAVCQRILNQVTKCTDTIELITKRTSESGLCFLVRIMHDNARSQMVQWYIAGNIRDRFRVRNCYVRLVPVDIITFFLLYSFDVNRITCQFTMDRCRAMD